MNPNCVYCGKKTKTQKVFYARDKYYYWSTSCNNYKCKGCNTGRPVGKGDTIGEARKNYVTVSNPDFEI